MSGQAQDFIDSASLTYRNVSEEAWVRALVAEAGVPLGSSRVGLALEFAHHGERSVLQTYRYDGGFRKEAVVRDATLFALVRWRLAPWTPVIAPEVVAGIGLVYQRSRERNAPGRFGFPDVYGPFGPEREVTETAWGLTGGLDLPLLLGRHLAVVPQFRATALERGETAELAHFPTFGLPSVVIRAAVALRAVF